MRVVICGSRTWDDDEPIIAALLALRRRARGRGERLEVIHGGAIGADTIAHRVAEVLLDVGVRAFPADWERHGKRAGYVRNCEMLDEKPERVVAFTLGSPGTQLTIDEARKRGIPVEVVGRERLHN